ncbi:MAG: FAD-dependent oxidoreductase [Pseudomonadota bacterium]
MYVIVGGGVAAIGAIEGIRSRDVRTPITLICRENHPVYGRPLIAEYLKGERSEEEIAYREPTFYEQMKVNLLLDEEAEGVDTAARTVLLAMGERLGYKRLLLATGGKPFMPPVDGLRGPDVYTFTTLDDAKRLVAAAPNISRAVVMGGGLIGLKVAEGLHARGVAITIVELAPRILSVAFDDTAGAIVLKRLETAGIEVHCNCSVAAVLREAGGAVRAVRLNDGRELPCNAVVVAIGVVPDKRLAELGGLTMNRGIVVDAYLRTSAARIYAAGDVAEAYDLSIKGKRVMPIWPNAYLQGRVAGKNMAGARERFLGGLPMNSIAFHGVSTISAGVSNPQGNGYEILQHTDPERGSYKKMVLKRGRLVGYVLVGDVARAGLLTGLIREGVDVASLKDRLLSATFGYAHLPEELRRARLA